MITYNVENGVVTFTECTAGDGAVLRLDRASLRCAEVEELHAFPAEAGFAIEGQSGDWARGPITARTRSIITVAAAPS